ncbi:TPA: ornithine carbamoyltransferase [Kluyvera georgiana]
MSVFDILNDALNAPYELGNNDCNIVALKIVDLRAGTTWANIAQYDTILDGYKQLKKLGYENTGDIVREFSDEVELPIDGDIWIDDENPLIMGIIFSNRMLGVNIEHNKFQLNPIRDDGVFYRVRKYNNGWNS